MVEPSPNVDRKERAFIAADLWARLDNGEAPTSEDLHWLDQPGNLEEVKKAREISLAAFGLDRSRSIDIQALADRSNVLRGPGAGRRAPAPARLRRIARVSVGIAATLSFMVVTAFVAQSWWQHNAYSTQTGEHRTVALPDGSIITLNTESSVRTAFSEQERTIYLAEGQATFAVAHDPSRPFRVHAGAIIVQAIGTQFDVRIRPDHTRVAVLEGRVQVSTELPDDSTRGATPGTTSDAVRVAAGEAVSIADPIRLAPPEPINADDIVAWQRRRLVFESATPVEMAEEFRRYKSTPRIRIEGEALARRRFSAVFNADSPDSLVRFLVSDGTVVQERDGDEIVLRPAP